MIKKCVGVKLFLFDMDGVLYHSMPNHAIAWQRAMKKYGIKMTEYDAYATEGMRGIDTIRIMVKQQQGKDISIEQAQSMYDEKAKIFGQLPTAPIMPGVIDIMKKIKQYGMNIVVVTGSGQKPLIERLKHDFNEYLKPENIVTAYDVEKGKPNPEPYLVGLKKGGNVLPENAVVIENAPMGVKAGVAAGIFTIAVNSGPLPDTSLKKQGADMVFDSMTTFNENWDKIFL